LGPEEVPVVNFSDCSLFVYTEKSGLIILEKHFVLFQWNVPCNTNLLIWTKL